MAPKRKTPAEHIEERKAYLLGFLAQLNGEASQEDINGHWIGRWRDAKEVPALLRLLVADQRVTWVDDKVRLT